MLQRNLRINTYVMLTIIINFASFVYNYYTQTTTGFNTNLKFAGSKIRTSRFTYTLYKQTVLYSHTIQFQWLNFKLIKSLINELKT